MGTTWLAAVITNEGVEVQSVHESREQARLACPSHGKALPLDDEAVAALARDYGVTEIEDVCANTILPDVWTERR